MPKHSGQLNGEKYSLRLLSKLARLNQSRGGKGAHLRNLTRKRLITDSMAIDPLGLAGRVRVVDAEEERRAPVKRITRTKRQKRDVELIFAAAKQQNKIDAWNHMGEATPPHWKEADDAAS